MNTRAMGDSDQQHKKTLSFLSHPGEPTDRYAKYLGKPHEADKKSKNARNLFDDSNTIDRKWFKRAVMYLVQAKQRPILRDRVSYRRDTAG